MKNLFTKFIYVALICNLSFQVGLAQQCPTVEDVSFPADIILSEDGITASNALDEMSPDILISTYGFSNEEVYPTWDDPDNCENLLYTYEDILFTGPTLKILRTWTVIDWDLNETATNVQVLKNITSSSSYCLNSVELSAFAWTCEAEIVYTDLLVSGFNYENLVFSPAEGTFFPLGTTIVNISGTVEGEDFNCTTTVVTVDDSPPVTIISNNVEFSLDPTSCTLALTPEMVDQGSHDGACGDISLSISPEFLTEEDAGEEVVITLTATDEAGNSNIAWTLATVNECGSNIGFECINLLTFGPLQNEGAQMYPEDFVSPGSTNSGDLSLSIIDEEGNFIVNNYFEQGDFGFFDYTLTDNQTGETCNGNISIPLPFLPCDLLLCYANVYLNLNETNEVTITPEILNSDFANCDNLNITIVDGEFDLIGSGPAVTMTESGEYFYTVENNDGNSCWGTLSISDYVPCPTSLTCNDEIFLSMFINPGGELTAIVTTDMILEGNTSACNIDNYLIELNDIGVAGFYYSGVGSVVVDQASIYTYTVTDPETGNSCWGNLTVESVGPCAGINDVNYPSNIDVAITDLNDSNIFDYLSPSNLVAELGFAEAQTIPTWTTGPGCTNLFYTYDDTVINLNNGSYKIIRTWTVLDWLTGEVGTQVQIINNIIFPGLICDFLPNSAPFGDCDSGHTDSDDVEWPDDLLDLADYRIKPSELETFSMIDVTDTKPIFVNNVDQYSADYVDILNELQINELTVGRVWTVTTGSTVVATYTQTLVIDISNFASLVSINTMFQRPIPEVDLTSNSTTNFQGVGFVDGDDQFQPVRADNPLNGLTFKDLIFILQHITGNRDFTEHQMRAADIQNNGSITTLDLLDLQNALLEKSFSPSLEWRFYENELNSINSTLLPKANFIGIKPGDVDDDAVLVADPQTESAIMVLSDVLINNGESYEATLEYDGEDLSIGVEIHLYYDENLIQVDELYVVNEDMNLEYNLDKPGEIHLVLSKSNLSGFLFSGENLVNIKFTASSNGLLSQAIDSGSLRNSYLIGLDYQLVVLYVEIGDQINTGVENTSDHTDIFSVFPNPATDLVNINFLDNTPSNYMIQFFDLSGKFIFQEMNKPSINVSSLSSGMYFYRLIDGNKTFTGHLSVSR